MYASAIAITRALAMSPSAGCFTAILPESTNPMVYLVPFSSS